jgi:cephalosporin-C deacetylase-like acetyl esterase
LRPILALFSFTLSHHFLICRYNAWAADYEHVIAKALFCGDTTWAGVMLSEDTRALDYLCSLPDVDSSRIGVVGLSGGGLRTVLLAGTDSRYSTSSRVPS